MTDLENTKEEQPTEKKDVSLLFREYNRAYYKRIKENNTEQYQKKLLDVSIKRYNKLTPEDKARYLERLKQRDIEKYNLMLTKI